MDQKEFKVLFSLMKNIVYREAYRWTQNHWDAEDITQEVFLRIWDKGIEPQNPAYLLKMARNIAIDRYRRHKNIPEQKHTNSNLSIDNSLDLLNFLAELSDIERICIELYYLEGYKIQEISEKLNIPVGTVKTHLYRGRQKLKRRIKDQWIE